MRLDAAGYMAPAQAEYLDDIKRKLAKAGLSEEFMYHGSVDRDAKLKFLQSLDVLSVPAPYDEPKGTFLLEAMGEGVPVVQMSKVQGLRSSGRSVSSFATMTVPSVAHWRRLQSPVVCSASTTPAASRCIPHVPAVQVRC